MYLAVDSATKDFWQVATWMVAAVGGPITAALAIGQAVANRNQRKRELRWKKAELARELSEEVWEVEESRCALRMVDAHEREFKLPSGQSAKIDRAVYVAALTTTDEPNGEVSIFVRDCFDELFFFLARLEHAIRTKLINFEDVQFPWEYYAKILAADKAALSAYNESIGYGRTISFFERFDVWNSG